MVFNGNHMHNIGSAQWITFASQHHPTSRPVRRQEKVKEVELLMGRDTLFIYTSVPIVLSLCHNGGVEKLVLIFHCYMSRVEIRSITTCKWSASVEERLLKGWLDDNSLFCDCWNADGWLREDFEIRMSYRWLLLSWQIATSFLSLNYFGVINSNFLNLLWHPANS